MPAQPASQSSNQPLSQPAQPIWAKSPQPGLIQPCPAQPACHQPSPTQPMPFQPPSQTRQGQHAGISAVFFFMVTGSSVFHRLLCLRTKIVVLAKVTVKNKLPASPAGQPPATQSATQMPQPSLAQPSSVPGLTQPTRDQLSCKPSPARPTTT